MSHAKRILVIRLSAFGDIIRSFSTLAAIRRHHHDAHITWMTTAPFARLLEGSGYVDAVWPVARMKWWQFAAVAAFKRQLAGGQFDLVYDLQRNDRTRLMRKLAPTALQMFWFADNPPHGEALDTRDISVFPLPDIGWMGGDAARFNLRTPYVLLVPGSAPQHPLKRWPAASYAALAARLVASDVSPVLIGAAAEQAVIGEIARAVPQAVDLCGKTSFGDIAALARDAACTIGNDTGPMHIIALSGCPIVSLFSGETDPARCGPQGGNTTILRAALIADLTPDRVWEAYQARRR